MLKSIFLLFLFISNVFIVICTNCDSYTNKCLISPPFITSNSIGIAIDETTPFYGYLTNINGNKYVSISVLYGTIEVFLAKDREPKTTDYDISTIKSFDKDFLFLDSSFQSINTINVLIISSYPTEISQIIIQGEIDTSIIFGYPFKLYLTSLSSTTISLPIINNNTFNVIASPITKILSNLTIEIVNTVSNQIQISDFNNSIQSITYQLDENENHNGFIVTFTNNYGFDLFFSAVVSENSNDNYPIYLLNGFSQQDHIDISTEKYYKLLYGIDETQLEITLDSIYGDADLFANPCSLGFYHRIDQYIQDDYITPMWSSQRVGRDYIDIPNYYSGYFDTNIEICITVYGYRDSVYSIKGISSTTVLTLTEEIPIGGYVDFQSYRYYKFIDYHPDKEIQFDVNPSTGDSDIYIGCISSPIDIDLGFPSRVKGHYNFSSTRYQEDALSIRPDSSHKCLLTTNPEIAVYYIAVYGDSAAEYTISVKYYGGTQTLMIGYPIEDKVYKTRGAWYQVRMGMESQQLTITLTPYDGDCDLYVKLGSTAHTWSYDYSSTLSNIDSDTIVIPEDKICQNCWVNILVMAYSTTRFSILATLFDTNVILIDSSPSKGSVNAGLCQYYTLPVTAQNGSLYAIITTLTGSTNLYASLLDSEPCSNSSHLLSSYFSFFPVVINGNIKSSRQVYFGVSGNGTYTIRASVVNPTVIYDKVYQLIGGIPQADTLYAYSLNDKWRYYLISLPAGHETLSIQQSPFAGEIQLFLGACSDSLSNCFTSGGFPNTTNSIAKNTNGLSLSYNRNDDKSTNYILGVFSNNPASYLISYTTSSSVLSLSYGVPVIDHAFRREYDYFSFYYNSNEDITITLTPFSGDPDIFVSTIYNRPNYRNNTWKSTDYGSDIITITPSIDDNACTDCTYYILVVGSSETTYSLLIQLESTLSRLLDGVPTSGFVDMLNWNYYQFVDNYGATRNIRISLSTYHGNADLYVTLDGSEPSWINYDFASSNWGNHNDAININSDSPNLLLCGLDTGICTVNIGIYGFLDSQYSIVITSSLASTLISHNIPKVDSVNTDSYNYYSTVVLEPDEVDNDSTDLELKFTLYSGSIKVFLSCQDSMPNSTFYHWSFIPSYDNSYSLVLPEVAFKDSKCTSNIYLSVYGVTSASFNILVSIVSGSNTLGYPALLPGQSMYSSISYHKFKWYVLRPGQTYQDIRLIATVLSGDVAIYVSSTYESLANYNAESGQVDSYVAKSDNIGGEDLLLDHRLLQTLCFQRVNCYFMVGVFGSYSSTGVSSTFTLLLSVQDSTTILTTGIPQRGIVNSGTYQYYKYSLTIPNTDLVFALTSFSGDSDLYVSTFPHPTRFNRTYSSSSYGSDLIVIQSTDSFKKCKQNSSQPFHLCDFYIGIYGFRNSSYSIVAMLDGGIETSISLIDGQPQTSHVETSRYIYFKYIVSTASEDVLKGIVITLDSLNGDADMYITFNKNSEPGRSNYIYRSTNFGSMLDEIEITPNMKYFCTNCEIYISVYGYENTTFSITASSSKLTMLQAGKAVNGHVNSKKYKYYSYFNNDNLGQISMTVTTISGDSDIYVSKYQRNETIVYPTITTHLWKSLLHGNDYIAIDYRDVNFCYDCVYVIGIYGYLNSTYSLLLTESEAAIITLTVNKPQNVQINIYNNTIPLKYFIFNPPNSIDTITISFTSISTAFADMFIQVRNASDSSQAVSDYPNPNILTSFQYSTVNTQDNSIVIPGPHDFQIVLLMTIKPRSSVYLPNPFIFSIVASTITTSIILQSGIPQNHFIDDDQTAHFIYYPSEVADLSISLLSRSGDPDLLISMINQYPSCSYDLASYLPYCSNYTWVSRLYSTDQIIISKDFPCKAILPSTVINNCDPDTSHIDPSIPIYIGVYGFTASRFSLIVTPQGKHTRLLSGGSQQSSTTVGYACSLRDPLSGVCIDTASIIEKVQVSYFTYISYPTATNINDNDFAITVTPNCDTSNSACQVGCECNPLYLYIQSCSISICTDSDYYPSRLIGQHVASLQISSDSGSTYLVDTTDPNFCNPNTFGEECTYYLAVSTLGENIDPATFTVSIRNAGQVNVVPCNSKTPNGYRTSIIDTTKSSNQHYEICAYGDSNDNEAIMLSLEQCSGDNQLYICGDDNSCSSVLPSKTVYKYYIGNDKVCVKDNCNEVVREKSRYTLPSVTLDAHAGNYFVMASGSGDYSINIQATSNNKLKSPFLYINEDFSSVSINKVLSTSGRSAKLTWIQPLVSFPDISVATYASAMKYHVFTLSKNITNLPKLNTVCGINELKKMTNLDYRYIVISPTGTETKSKTMTKLIGSLHPSTTYNIVIMAECDTNCLLSLSKVNDHAYCLDSNNVCQSQYYVYDPFQLTTSNDDSSDSQESLTNNQLLKQTIAGSVVVILVVLLIMIGFYAYWKRVQIATDEPSYKMTEMVDSSMFNRSRQVKPVNSKEGSTIYFNKDELSNDSTHSEYEPPKLVQESTNTFDWAKSSISTAARRIIGAPRDATSNNSSNNVVSKAKSTNYSKLISGSKLNDDDDEIEVNL